MFISCSKSQRLGNNFLSYANFQLRYNEKPFKKQSVILKSKQQEVLI